MNFGFLDFLQLVGSLGVFLYGMKLMSESMQKVAGNKMRNILSAMTSNRLKGVLTGFLITTLIQSSAATTVMVVSFVNAGMLTLVESIGVIMGANVGTTATAWIISILGFKITMVQLSLPLIAISLPFLFSGKRSRKIIGDLLVGIGLLFIGLDFLMDSMPKVDQHPEVLSFLKDYSNLGYGSYFIFLLIGTILTILIQSSSATITLTIVMCAQGWISFDIAAAMVLGENIGSTVTANIAAMVANTTAKRAALAHLVFNIFGVIWVLAIFPYFTDMIAEMCKNLGLGDPQTNLKAVPVALSLFHTTFNISNTLLMIWFAKSIASLVTKLLPNKENSGEVFTLKHIKIGLLSTPEASLFQAKQEISLYGKNTKTMFEKVAESLEMNKNEYEKRFVQLDKMEDESDLVEVEIADYLTKVSESKLSTESSQRVRAMFKIVSEIESIADSSLNIAKAYDRRNQANISFPEELNTKLKHMFVLVNDALQTMCNNLSTEYHTVNPKKAYELERAINDYRTILKQEHLIAIGEKKYDYSIGILYNDIFSECEKVGDFVINVTEAIKEIGND